MSEYKHFYKMDIEFSTECEYPTPEAIVQAAGDHVEKLASGPAFKSLIHFVETTETLNKPEQIICRFLNSLGTDFSLNPAGTIQKTKLLIDVLEKSGYSLEKGFKTLSHEEVIEGQKNAVKAQKEMRAEREAIAAAAKRQHGIIISDDDSPKCLDCDTTAKDAGILQFKDKSGDRFTLCNSCRRSHTYGYLTAVPMHPMSE